MVGILAIARAQSDCVRAIHSNDRFSSIPETCRIDTFVANFYVSEMSD